ncbi:MAG TPA: hypothetical protein VHX90_05450 [Verrucomicrobiae bacterium]|nr:hypothetical protein [Verrucomicrobiae bacterium]
MIVAAAAAAVSGARAQSSVTTGQAIVFSAPDDGDAVSNTPSLAAQPPVSPDFGDAHAPDFNFQTPATTGTRLPVTRPATVSQSDADRRANWALLTPAEILGVTTPDQVLKMSERDAAGQRKNSTAVERFYERQNEAQTNGAGGFFPSAPPLHGNFQDKETVLLNANIFKPSVGGFGNPAQASDSFRTPVPGKNMASGQNGDEGWLKTFVSTETKAEQSPSQAADMAEFRKLLEPIQPPKPSSTSSGDGLFSASKTSVFGQPANPSSGLFNNNGIGGYPALPVGVGQSIAPAVTAAPDWKPKLPPWMLKGPQPGVVPQRQF